jgi:hypothetical protein
MKLQKTEEKREIYPVMQQSRHLTSFSHEYYGNWVVSISLQYFGSKHILLWFTAKNFEPDNARTDEKCSYGGPSIAISIQDFFFPKMQQLLLWHRR